MPIYDPDFLPDVLKMHVPMLESKSSLFVNEHSAYAARLSCGGAVEMCDAVASDRIRNGFAVIRPPGHHAEPHKSMGFCLFNNVAVATRCLLQKYPNTIRKVLILDWDVHHGNGTQRAFESDPDVLYVSLHRYDEDGSFYPGSTYGHYTSAGTGPGKGRSVNVPWPCHGMGDADYMYAFQHLVMPIAHEFAPDMVIVSAGFDAAEGDPIGHNLVSPGGFAQMTHALASLCQGKMAVILEGGYNPDAIASSALAVTDVLLSGRALPPSTTVASSLAHDTVREVCRYHQRYWKSIKVPPLLADDADSDGVDQPNSHQMSEIVAGYRNSAIKEKYELFNVPMEDTPYSDFSGQVMCSERILDGFSTILFFVHDMGNLRSERSLSGLSLTQEALRLVDASTLIMDYAQSRGYGLVDMNINREFSAVNPVLPPGIERPPLWTDVDAAELDEACQAAAFIWDNVVALAGMSQGAKKVVMVGLGSGCNVLTSLIDHRDVQRRVKAVVNVVGYDEMPHVSANADVTKKKWYFAKSHVLAPADHRHLLERGDNAPLKRFGRIHPIGKFPITSSLLRLRLSLARIDSFRVNLAPALRSRRSSYQHPQHQDRGNQEVYRRQAPETAPARRRWCHLSLVLSLSFLL